MVRIPFLNQRHSMSHTPLHTRKYQRNDILLQSFIWGIATLFLGIAWYLLIRHAAPFLVLMSMGTLCIWALFKTARNLRTLQTAHIPAFTVSRAGLTFSDGSIISWQTIERTVADPTSGSIVLFLKSNKQTSLRDRIKLSLANSLYRLSPFVRGKNVVIIRPLLDSTDEILTLIESLLG